MIKITPSDILQTFSDKLQINTLLAYVLRGLAWIIIRGLKFLVDKVEEITNTIFTMNNFFKSTEVVKFIDSYKPVLIPLFTLGLLWVGYQIMIGNIQEYNKVLKNILFAICILIILPQGMDRLNEITLDAINTVTTTEKVTIADNTIKDNVYDMKLYDETNFASNSITNKIPMNMISKIDVNEVIKSKDAKNSEVFKHKLIVNSSGNYEMVELDKGLFSWNEYYSRYAINFGTIIIILGVVGVSLAFTSIKAGRIIYELAIHRIIATFIATVDLNGGQRMKEAVKHIINTFAVLFSMAVLLKMYLLFSSFINTSNINVFVKVVLFISASLALIDGPNLIEKILGIDAGLKNGYQSMASTYMAGKTIMGAAQMAGSLGSKIVQGGLQGGATIAGTSKGIYDSIKDNKKGSKNNNDSLYDKILGSNKNSGGNEEKFNKDDDSKGKEKGDLKDSGVKDKNLGQINNDRDNPGSTNEKNNQDISQENESEGYKHQNIENEGMGDIKVNGNDKGLDRSNLSNGEGYKNKQIPLGEDINNKSLKDGKKLGSHPKSDNNLNASLDNNLNSKNAGNSSLNETKGDRENYPISDTDNISLSDTINSKNGQDEITKGNSNSSLNRENLPINNNDNGSLRDTINSKNGQDEISRGYSNSSLNEIPRGNGNLGEVANGELRNNNQNGISYSSSDPYSNDSNFDNGNLSSNSINGGIQSDINKSSLGNQSKSSGYSMENLRKSIDRVDKSERGSRNKIIKRYEDSRKLSYNATNKTRDFINKRRR